MAREWVTLILALMVSPDKASRSPSPMRPPRPLSFITDPRHFFLSSCSEGPGCAYRSGGESAVSSPCAWSCDPDPDQISLLFRTQEKAWEESREARRGAEIRRLWEWCSPYECSANFKALTRRSTCSWSFPFPCNFQAFPVGKKGVYR